MKRSESIINLTAALAQAQGAFSPAVKSGINPHLKNRYATLDSVIAAVREPLRANGLSFVQPLTGDGEDYLLETILFHESGEWIGCETVIPESAGNRGVNELQAFGGSLTYMRRYMLTALLGISSDDDVDGNGPDPKKEGSQKPVKKAPAKPSDSTKHWIENPDTRKRFWVFVRNDMQMTDTQAHEALGVKSVKDFTGTPKDAKAKIEAWRKAHPVEPPLDDLDLNN
jgi:hypothetical protein